MRCADQGERSATAAEVGRRQVDIVLGVGGDDANETSPLAELPRSVPARRAYAVLVVQV